MELVFDFLEFRIRLVSDFGFFWVYRMWGFKWILSMIFYIDVFLVLDGIFFIRRFFLVRKFFVFLVIIRIVIVVIYKDLSFIKYRVKCLIYIM